jgi:hypothetical protein
MCEHKKIVFDEIENEYICSECGEYIDYIVQEKIAQEKVTINGITINTNI